MKKIYSVNDHKYDNSHNQEYEKEYVSNVENVIPIDLMPCLGVHAKKEDIDDYEKGKIDNIEFANLIKNNTGRYPGKTYYQNAVNIVLISNELSHLDIIICKIL